MSCEVEIIADCGDLSCLGRSLFITEKDSNWLTQCVVAISSCGNILAVGYKTRLCILTSQWITSAQNYTFIISWSGTVESDISAILVLPQCSSKNKQQSFPDWFCIVTGFSNGYVGFYTHTGYLLLNEKFDEKPVMKISCHTGTYGTLPDDVCILYQNSECIIAGVGLFKLLRYAKAQLAKVEAGVLDEYSVTGKNLNVSRWIFGEDEVINDATVAGLELKNIYDHLLSASTYGGYDTWYRSIPPQNTLILGAGVKPYLGFHYALEGGTAPPLQDVARAVANKIKSALPGWLGGGSTEAPPKNEPNTKSEALSMRSGLYDAQRQGTLVALSPDRRLAAVADNLGRVAVLDVAKGHVFRLFKGYRDVQCAFVQVFEADEKKPQLSVIKDIRRALFLVIYNPRKGLIEIRLMNKGNRIAVFTATKNGKLLYNTSGLVGIEQGYNSKKLNLPKHQCVLIDPDGKLKTFNIPFFYALEGEHSDRSKDLHILRELRDFIKRSGSRDDEFETEVITRASELQTIELKKHCLEMLIRNYEISPKVAMACVDVFCSETCDDDTDAEVLKCRNYFVNLTLATLFYRQINGENVNDMDNILTKFNIGEITEDFDSKANEIPTNLTLLKSDTEMLERLLELAQEKDYKENHHARVKFADSGSGAYKLFVNAFDLEADPKEGPRFKSDLIEEKYNELAADTFNSLFKINNLEKISKCINACKMSPKEFVKLIITHVANMSLESLSMDLIENLLRVLYSVCVVTSDATVVQYSTRSDWWGDVRAELPHMPCPLRTLFVAMSCRALVCHFERSTHGAEDPGWVSVTQENAQWSILIGKLEDIAILSIVVYCKETYDGDSLPKLPMTKLDFNLGYIYSKGKGSVSELIARWLCTMGAPPEAVIVNDLLAKGDKLRVADGDDSYESVFLENNKECVDKNPRIFKWLSLLKKQFPYSTSADIVITNVAWEYAAAWKNDLKNIDLLGALVRNIKSITDVHLALGVCIMIWSFTVRYMFEAACKLVSKVGKCPKERLCLQDVGLTERQMFKFLETASAYLEHFKHRAMSIENSVKTKFIYEKIWDEGVPCFIDVAQKTKHFNMDLLNINHEISLSILFQCQFNMKISKHLSTLYDVDLQYVFEGMTADSEEPDDTNYKALESKLRPARMKFLNKVIMSSLELITCSEDAALQNVYNKYKTDEAMLWIDRAFVLGALWNIDADFLKRQQVIGLYRAGYDSLAEHNARLVLEPTLLMPPLLAVAARRLKRHLEASANPADWIASVPPALVHHLDTIESDTSVATHNTIESTAAVVQNVLCRIENADSSPVHTGTIRLAECILKGCEIIIQEKL